MTPPASFHAKLHRAIAANRSRLVVGLDPNPEMMPGGDESGADRSYRLDDLRAWLRQAIAKTYDRVCAYKPTLGFYLALGAEGMTLLEEVLAEIAQCRFVAAAGECCVPIVLDAKHADLNTGTALARLAFERWQVDAIILPPYIGQDVLVPFAVYPDKAAFVNCRTSNPSAAAIQDYPSPDRPLYQHVAREARRWGSPDRLALEVGTSDPEVLAAVRAIAPERVILARSIWSEGSDLDALLEAGQGGGGLLLPVPQDWLRCDDLDLRVARLNLHVDAIERIARNRSKRDTTATALTPPPTPTPTPPKTPRSFDPAVLDTTTAAQRDLIRQLYDADCVLFGDFIQAAGDTFPYYIDLRQIISNPPLFQAVLDAYADILRRLRFDRIAGIPYGSLPTATGLSLMLEHPLIFPRKEVKAHGTRRAIEGEFHPGETIAVIDDTLITGKSIIEGIAKLESVGLRVTDLVVLIEQGCDVLGHVRRHGYTPHAVLSLAQISHGLYDMGRIDAAQFEAMQYRERGAID
ncbi:MAG: orotidine-5'-phosphate decarboxylase [Geitlerinemataceae cyanobacterium]